jgi:hypothetical protein
MKCALRAAEQTQKREKVWFVRGRPDGLAVAADAVGQGVDEVGAHARKGKQSRSCNYVKGFFASLQESFVSLG